MSRLATGLAAANLDSIPVMVDDAEGTRVPLADVLPGMGIRPFEEGTVPLSAFVLVKLLDADGDPNWGFRTTESLNLEELLGALTVQVDLLKASIAAD